MDVLHEHMDNFQNYRINIDGRIDLLQNILRGNVNVRDSTGNTLLHLALQQIKTNVVDLVKHLLEMGAEVNALNYSGLSPLHCAIKYKNCSVDVLKLLIDRGAKVQQKTYLGLTPLEFAMEKGPIDAIKFLFQHAGNIHITNELGVSLMHFVVMRNLPVEFVQLLLDKGVDYHASSGSNNHGESPLHLAVAFKRIEILKLLLKQPGVQVDLPDYMGYSPLHHCVAASTCNIGVIKMLLDSGADVEKKTRAGMRPMHFAMYSCKIEVIKLLLEYGAQVNVAELSGRTPLYLAVKFCPNENIEALKLLLDAGASLFFTPPLREVFPLSNSPYDDATSPLVVASQKHCHMQSEYSLQRVQLLLKYAVLENPEIIYENLSDHKETCVLLSQYGSECLRELHSTCIDGSRTLAQFIRSLRLHEDENSHTDEILELLVTNAHPMYRDVILFLLKRKELEDKFKDRNMFLLKKGLGQACALRRVVLHYDVLCCLMKYLSKEDLLNLFLAFHEAHKDEHVDLPGPSDASQNAKEAESERVFKRAKVN